MNIIAKILVTSAGCALAIGLVTGCTHTYRITTHGQLAALNGSGPLKVRTAQDSVYRFRHFTYNDSVIIGRIAEGMDFDTVVTYATISFSNLTTIESDASNPAADFATDPTPPRAGTYQITTSNQLAAREGKGPLNVLTVQDSLYKFSAFTFNDSLIRGTLENDAVGDTTRVTATVPFNRVAFIEGWSEIGAGRLAVGAIATGAAMALMLSAPSSLDIHRTGSSCPTIYANNGSHFVLDGEAFGTSLSKAFEERTFCVLPDLVPVDGIATMRVSNERPETHMVNSIDMLVGDAGDATDVVLDTANVLWPVHTALPPRVTARTSDAKYRDRVECNFDVPRGAREATLIVRAINTDLIGDVFRLMGNVLGDAQLQFYHTLENDTTLQRRMRMWKREASLRVEIGTDTGFAFVGMIAPEATAVSFTRAIRIGGLDTSRGGVRFRLTSLHNVWDIDSVTLDCAPAAPVATTPLTRTNVVSSNGTTMDEAIARQDSAYAMLLPPDHVDVSFDARPASRMRHPVYLSAVRGYLYEWLPNAGNQVVLPMPLPRSRGGRVAMLSALLEHRDILLPLLFESVRQRQQSPNDYTLSAPNPKSTIADH